ncbi:apolipoprotein L3-like [Antechinus flavipes]|uniref:apolipoprotein L3-like n=1 Tax=Antechinus flavipes TaxID=38775 RepID=UPI00223609C7|nr:apolipoprotein L3-like [Antechinus flavipes]
MDNADVDMMFKKVQRCKLEKLRGRLLKMKANLEKVMQELCCMADRIDKIHKDCTITSVVANSAGAVSGVLNILGISLAPVTAGGSLVLFATGLGLGLAAGVTGLSANIVDRVTDCRGRKHLNQVKRKSDAAMKGLAKEATRLIKELGKFLPKDLPFPNKAASYRGTWGLGAAACQSPQAFQRAVLSTSKGARILGSVAMGLAVLLDVATVVKDSRHLLKGAKSTTAAELRENARTLKEKVQELSEICEDLQKTLN